MVFYDTREEAIAAGYRGCLRCHSAEYQFQPQWLTDMVAHLHDHLDQKLSMSDLEELTGKHRSTITERFSQQYGSSPLDYHREVKLEAAKHRILQGEDYRDVAFGLGYDSLSGFRSAFKDYFQTTPGQIQEVVE